MGAVRTDRRGFLGALLAAPVLARMAPAPPVVQPYTLGLEYFIRADTWAPGPKLTEAAFVQFLEEGMRWGKNKGPRYFIASPEWREKIERLEQEAA